VPQPGATRTAPFGQPKFEDAARVPGEPSSEALRRLQAAVQSVPKAAPMVRQVASQPREAERSSRLTINSLIHKMTGQVGREQPNGRRGVESEPRASQIEPDYEDTERERVDIPAFLRRQAN
jgi:cell division protein FtsZ